MNTQKTVLLCVLLLIITAESRAFFVVDPNFDLSLTPCFSIEGSLNSNSPGELVLRSLVSGDRDTETSIDLVLPFLSKKCNRQVDVKHGFIQNKRLTQQLRIDSRHPEFVNIGTYFPPEELVKSASWTGWLPNQRKASDIHLPGARIKTCEVRDHFMELSKVRRMTTAYEQLSFYPQSWNIGKTGGKCSRQEIPSHAFLLRISSNYLYAGTGCYPKKYGHVAVIYLLGENLKIVLFKNSVLLEAACETSTP